MSRRSIRLRVAFIVSSSIVAGSLSRPRHARARASEWTFRTRSGDGARAFVGEVLGVANDDELIRYRFRVEEVAAETIASELVALITSPERTECGVGLENGERAVFVLGRREGAWVVSTCGQADPDEMLRAASFLGSCRVARRTHGSRSWP